MSFTYGGYCVAALEFESILGRSGLGFYRLGFSCKCSLPGDLPLGISISDVFGQAYARGSSGKEVLLGMIFPEAPIYIETAKKGFETRLLFYIDLEPSRIEAIEELRNGGDISFRLIVSGIAQGLSGNQPLHVQEATLSLNVNQRSWIDVLAEAGYGRFLLFEIPYPSPDGSGELAQALDHLQKAKDQFAIGHYDETVGRCRRAIESLTAGLGDEEKLKTAREEYFSARESRKEMSIDSRILFLRETIRHTTHPAAHGDSGHEEHYSRHDARLVLSVTATMLTYALRMS